MSSMPPRRGGQQPAHTNGPRRSQPAEPLQLTIWIAAAVYLLSTVILVIAAPPVARLTPVLLSLALLPLLAVLTVFVRRERRRARDLAELTDAYHGTALVLGRVVASDEQEGDERGGGFVSLCLAVADNLDLTSEQRRNLELGALLHDIGQIAIPREIIDKPGKLNPAEWSIVRTHTIEGQRMLDNAGGLMHRVGQIVRSHHERWDGSGYPDGLAGEEIPLEARIIACCETWTAMRADRSYRPALPFDTAAAEMRAIAGSQLDPRIASTLIAVVDEALHPVRIRPAA